MREAIGRIQRQMAQAEHASQRQRLPRRSLRSSTAASTRLGIDRMRAIQDLRERQALQESEIATQEQAKVESESKYPVKVTGMLLMNGFMNTSAVDLAATPTVAMSGSGNAGASVRQTMLGFDAHGPAYIRRAAASLICAWTSTATRRQLLGTTLFRLQLELPPCCGCARPTPACTGTRPRLTSRLIGPSSAPTAPTSLTATASLRWRGQAICGHGTPRLSSPQNLAFHGSHWL